MNEKIHENYTMPQDLAQIAPDTAQLPSLDEIQIATNFAHDVYVCVAQIARHTRTHTGVYARREI